MVELQCTPRKTVANVAAKKSIYNNRSHSSGRLGNVHGQSLSTRRSTYADPFASDDSCAHLALPSKGFEECDNNISFLTRHLPGQPRTRYVDEAGRKGFMPIARGGRAFAAVAPLEPLVGRARSAACARCLQSWAGSAARALSIVQSSSGMLGVSTD